MKTLAGFGEVVYEFPVLYSGWEGDNEGYVVRDEHGEHKLVLSSHGRLYYAEAAELTEKIEEYQSAIDASRAALALLSPATPPLQ